MIELDEIIRFSFALGILLELLDSITASYHRIYPSIATLVSFQYGKKLDFQVPLTPQTLLNQHDSSQLFHTLLYYNVEDIQTKQDRSRSYLQIMKSNTKPVFLQSQSKNIFILNL